MISENELKDLIVFDLETSSEFSTLDELREVNSHRALLWELKCQKMFEKTNDDKWQDVNRMYETQTALQPEFGRIVCASFLQIVFDGPNQKFIGIIKSFYDNQSTDMSEVDCVLSPVSEMLDKVSKTARAYKLCGHNIKKFDVPYLSKRLIMKNLPVAPILQTWGKKPWEINMFDTGEAWSMGVWDQYISLDLLTNALDLPSPKEFMKGEYVGEAFYKLKQYDEIALYCEEDIKAAARVAHKLSGTIYPIEFVKK